MLCVKSQRIERIIASIDEMLKGDQNMDLTVFDETEIRSMFTDMLQNMNESQKQIFVDHYGSIEAWEQYMKEAASDENVQKNFAKIVEWYGGKEAVKESVKNQPNSEVFAAYQKRIDDIQKRISEKKGTDVTTFEVRQLIGEYDFVAKQLYQVKVAEPLLMDIAKEYQENEKLIAAQDSVYGSGSAKYLGEAIESFYTTPSKK
jgi:alpha-glucosidase (family GH31 glycosyl hydrolase)